MGSSSGDGFLSHLGVVMFKSVVPSKGASRERITVLNGSNSIGYQNRTVI